MYIKNTQCNIHGWCYHISLIYREIVLALFSSFGFVKLLLWSECLNVTKTQTKDVFFMRSHIKILQQRD